MALMTIREYRETRFTEASAPTPRTVRAWVDKGEIYGKLLGGKLYVDPDIEVVRPVNKEAERIFHYVASTQT